MHHVLASLLPIASHQRMVNYQHVRSRAHELRALLTGLLIVVAGSGLATQYCARAFAYQSALGHPLVGRLYAPWMWWWWQSDYHGLAPTVFLMVDAILLVTLVSAGIALITLIGFANRRPLLHQGVHGTAHFATEQELTQTGLLPLRQSGLLHKAKLFPILTRLAPNLFKNPPVKEGVYVGAWQDTRGRLHYLRYDGPGHVTVCAPTRSGKGVGLIIPTVLSWPHSAIVHDPKGELWALTSGWRKRHANNLVIKLDAAAEKGSAHYNPLEEIRLLTPHEVGDVQNLVTIIVDPHGQGLVDHWAKTSHALLTGVLLHLLYQTRTRQQVASLADVAHALSDPSRPVDELYTEMLTNKHLAAVPHSSPNVRGEDGQHKIVAAAARDMLNRPEQERGSVLSSAMSFLSIYRDPLVAANMATSDFRIADLMDNERPCTLYLVSRDENKERLRPLMRLLINQFVRGLVREELRFENGRPLQPHKHKLLLMLDEFKSFGRLEIFQEALAFIAGYGMRAYVILQDTTQLAIYGREEGILSNSAIRVAYAPNRIETAEWLSKTLGTTTIVKEDITTSGKRFGTMLNHVSRSYHEVARPLLTPDECLRLPGPRWDSDGRIVEPGEVLVLPTGHPPIRGTQILYFRDPIFSARARLPPPPTDRVPTSPRVSAFEVSTP